MDEINKFLHSTADSARFWGRNIEKNGVCDLDDVHYEDNKYFVYSYLVKNLNDYIDEKESLKNHFVKNPLNEILVTYLIRANAILMYYFHDNNNNNLAHIFTIDELNEFFK